MNIEMPTTDFIAALNTNLPEGLRVISAAYKHNKDNIMGKVDELRCLIKFETQFQKGVLEEALGRMLAKQEIFVEKTTKKGKSIVEIRSKIRHAQVLADGIVALYCDAGSHSNLSPDLFVTALLQEAGVGSDLGYVTVHRTAVLIEKDGELVNPMDEKALN